MGIDVGLCDVLVCLAWEALGRLELWRDRGAHPCTGALAVVPIAVLGPGAEPVARATAENHRWATGERPDHGAVVRDCLGGPCFVTGLSERLRVDMPKACASG